MFQSLNFNLLTVIKADILIYFYFSTENKAWQFIQVV